MNSFRNKTIWRAGRLFVFKRRLKRINNDNWFERVRLSKRSLKKIEPFSLLMVAYIVLHMQNESGCATEKRCDFPYMSYYKYLLKRRQYKLLKYVMWINSPARTKNQINNYKIELQLHVPNAYSIISKNESHIRMASSTWHVAKTVKVIAKWFFCITIAYVVCRVHITL